MRSNRARSAGLGVGKRLRLARFHVAGQFHERLRGLR
jgi:hypothetical protein